MVGVDYREQTDAGYDAVTILWRDGARSSIFTMDLVDSRPNDPDWIEFNRRFNVLAAQFGGGRC